MATSNSLKRAMHSQMKPPQKRFNTKNWLTVTMMKLYLKKPSLDLAATKQKRKTTTIRWTVAEAAAVVASWKMLRQENQVAMSAETALKD